MGERDFTVNYHTHTWRCKHASGEEHEYVEKAIEAGIKVLGFSDHTPIPFEGDFVGKTRMDVDQLEDYVDTVLRLKNEYRSDIEIHLGLEAEYYPKYWEGLLALVEPYPIEYFLLGQHFLGNEVGEQYCGWPTPNPEDLIRYCEQTETAMETGCFLYLAHPDLINFTGDQGLYKKWMRRLCLKAKELGLPLEINLLGVRTKRHYPNPLFWEIAGEVGNTCILGSDAHNPQDVYEPESTRSGRELAERHGLPLLSELSLKKPSQKA